MEKHKGLWEHLAETYDLNLVGSEIDDILLLARQEIELPDENEIAIASFDEIPINVIMFSKGARWALNKVRNPYPKPM